MSSASVFNPHVLAELRHIRPMSMSVDRVSKNFTPSFAALSAVRRNIFGPVDHEECRILVEKNLQQQAEKDMEYWGFDFVNEVPLPGKSRYTWEPRTEKPVSRPQKRSIEPAFDISHLYAEPLEDVVRPATVKDDDHQNEQNVQKIEKVKQSLITDFLKSKKSSSTNRLKQLKKMSVTPSPNRTGKVSRPRRSIRS